MKKLLILLVSFVVFHSLSAQTTKCTEEGVCVKGNWKGDKLNGYGEVFYPNGNILYKGQFKNSSKHGQGILYDISGNIIFNGKITGNDFYGHYRPQFTILEGSDYGGKCVDILIQKNPNRWDKDRTSQIGDYYIGDFEDSHAKNTYDVYDGFGSYHYLNGDIHEGNWNGGTPYGNGKIKDKNGNIIFEAIWQYGSLIKIIYENNPKTYSTSNISTNESTSSSNSNYSDNNSNTTNPTKNEIKFGDWTDFFRLINNTDIYYSVQDIKIGGYHQFGFKFKNKTNNKISFNFRFGIDGKLNPVEVLNGSETWFNVTINPDEVVGSGIDFNTGVLLDKQINEGKVLVKDISYTNNSSVNWAKVGTAAFFIGGAIALVSEMFNSTSSNSSSTSKTSSYSGSSSSNSYSSGSSSSSSSSSYKCRYCNDTKRCSQCAGKGQNICSYCKGTGRDSDLFTSDRECYHCDGKGYNICKDCSGRGVCSHCRY